ncbi:MAG: AEC family transporter [Desulfotignum sp.]|jgi:predicted permease|nr:AEC family transporter [Desulfotignum sp.]
MFLPTFSTVFSAVFQVFIISAAAGVMVRAKIVSQAHIQALSTVTVNIFLPCLIVVKTVSQFDPTGFALWWILPLSGVLIALSGLGMAALLFGTDPKKQPFVSMASFQNAVYIVLPIGQLVYPDQFDRLALFCFLLILGQSPIMWSVGKVLVSGRQDAAIVWKDFVTPPLVATLAAIFLVVSGTSAILPQNLLSAMDLLGQATVPLAVFILGATLGSIALKDMPPLQDVFRVAGVKFVLVPGMAFAVMYGLNFYQTLPLFCSLIILQTSSPPATNLILMVRNYGGDTQAVASMMLLQYLVCILAMPLWLSLWHAAVG